MLTLHELCQSIDVVYPGFPLGLENLEKWESIFQSGNFDQTEKSGDLTQNTGKYGK